MPCPLGRSQHTLLRKDCQSSCACCVNTAYSVSKPFCDEPVDNSKSRDIRDLACTIIKETVDQNGCDSGLFFFNTLKLPREHCKVVLEMRNLTQGNTTIFEIENGNIRDIEINNPVDGDLLVYFVDGVECLRCTLIS